MVQCATCRCPPAVDSRVGWAGATVIVPASQALTTDPLTMLAPPLLPIERERLQVLHELHVLDTEVAPVFAAIARLACLHSACSIGAISLVDATRQWFAASVGLAMRQTPREASFCGHTICSDAGMEVPDATQDARFRDNPLVVGDPHIVFYAGMPIHVDGQRIGTVLVMDQQARTGDAGTRAALADLALVVGAMFDARLREQRWKQLEARVSAASQAGSDWLWETDAEGVLTWVSDSVAEHTGWLPATEIGRYSAAVNRPPTGEGRASWDVYRAQRARHEPFYKAIAERDTAHGHMLVEMSGRPRFDASGTFLGYCGAARNVTREVAEREALLSDQRLLQHAIESVNAGLMVSGPDGKIRISNSSWRRNIGLFSDGGQDTWEALLREMVRRGQYPQARGREEEFVRWRLSLASAEGIAHELHFGEQVALITDQRLPDGSVVHLSINITESRRAELELQRQRALAGASEARLGAVLKAVPDLWFVLDAAGCYVECSDNDHPWLVRPFAELRGLHVGSLAKGRLSTDTMATIARAHATGTVQRFEYELTTVDGVHRSFEARLSPMPDGHSLYLTRDLTEVRQLAREVMLLQRALEADAALPMVVADMRSPEHPLIFVNRAFERLTGYDRSEVLGRNCRFMQGPDTDPLAVASVRRALAEGTPCTVTLRNRRRDGSSFLNELHLAPVHDEAGALVSFIGVQNDVTHQALAAEKLQRSEEFYRAVTEGIRDGVLVVAPAGSILTSNPAARAALGVSAEQLAGTRLSRLGFELQHLSDGRPVTDAEHPVAQVMRRGGRVVDAIYRLRRPDGALMHIQLSAQPLFERPGAGPTNCLVMFRDITAQRAAEEALLRAEERWQFALDGSGEGIWDFDEDTQVVYFSPQWKQTLGHEEHEIGSALTEWTRRIHPEDKPRVLRAIQQYRQGLAPTYQTEHRLRHKLGHWVWILDRGKIVERRADGSPRRVVGTHTDITHMKAAEQALRDKQALALASRAKSEFLSRMSHEMRTPLNAVIGFTQLMRMQPGGGDSGKVIEYTDYLMRASQHLLDLINEVLDLQQVEEGRIKLERLPISLSQLVDSTIELLQPMAQQARISVTAQIAGDVWVLADRQRLHQVLINVVSNAIKYNRPQGSVCITVLAADARVVRIAIEDTGCGLSAQQLGRLFQPFERLGHESSSIQGTGLGLVIARRLVEEMGGTLTLSSVHGAGTLAQIDLPRAEAQLPAPALPVAPTWSRSVPPPDRAPVEATRVLYVEDNVVNAILFQEAMRLCGNVELRMAEDGAETLALVRDWLPDVLVLDAHLPDMTGFELLDRLRGLSELCNVPAYMCSAAAMPADLQRAREAGFKGYWTKPIDIALIVSQIDALAVTAS